MSKILVSGLINLETTLRVDGFPIDYFPVRYQFYGVNSSISGVGFNIAKALSTLGDEVEIVSMVGNDFPGHMALKKVEELGISPKYILNHLDQTAQSVILFDNQGRRQINTDLKNIQDQNYPTQQFDRALVGADLAVLCNINYSRPFLRQVRTKNIRIATDVHAIAHLDDEYNRDFMENAHILFMSHEHLPDPPDKWARKVIDRFGVEILVIGLGSDGALLAVRDDHFMEQIPSVNVRPIVNTIGAGDALFSCFIHFFLKTNNPYEAIRKAILFASYKIGTSGAADGFLSSIEVDRLANEHYSNY